MARTIQEQGTLPGIQLSTAWEGYVGAKSFRSPSGSETIEQSRDIVRSFSKSKIDSILELLDRAAQISIDSGYRHLQVHAAHGYLFNLLVDDRLNKNASDVRSYLGDWANKYVNCGVETSIRISYITGDNNFDSSGSEEFVYNISKLPFDFIDVSSGFYNIDKRIIYPARKELIQERRNSTIAIAKKIPDSKFILSGKVYNFSNFNLPKNLHIGLCRDLIANPNFLKGTKNGCMNFGKCHYYSRVEDYISCGKWYRIN